MQLRENSGHLLWIFRTAGGVIKEELLVTPSASHRKAMDSLKPVVIDTQDPYDLASEAYDIVAAEGIKTICMIPLVNRGRAVGLLSIFRRTEAPFLAGDVDFFSRASGQIAIAVENALAYGEISELKDKLALEKLYLEDEIRSEMNFAQIIGSSASLRKVLKYVESVAPKETTVYIYE